MTSNENFSYLLKLLAASLVLLYFETMIVLYRSDLQAVYQPPLLLLITNTLFAGLIPAAVSIIAASSYLFSGMNSLFLWVAEYFMNKALPKTLSISKSTRLLKT